MLRAALALVIALAAPAAWGADLCRSGQRQSPIDITAAQRPGLPALHFDFHAAAARIDNDGHTVRVRIASGSSLSSGAGPLQLQQFHFHIPGGDRLQGEEFPLALHFLHKGSDGRLVALVALFRIGAEHPALAALLPQLPGRGQPGLAAATVDPNAWLPAGHRYYAYDGSLTAPPCTEGVHWIVLQQAQTLSAAQLQHLQTLFPRNARAVQPLHGREVGEGGP